MAGLRSRGLGLVLIAVATGPLLVFLVCSVLVAVTIGSAVSDILRRTAPIIATIGRDVTPAVARLQADLGELEGATATARDEADRAIAGLSSIGAFKIAAGQFGRTPLVRIRLPADDLTLGALDLPQPIAVSLLSDRSVRPASYLMPAVVLAFGFDDVKKGAEGVGKDIGKGVEQGGKALENSIPKPTLRAGSVIDKDLPALQIPPAPIDIALPGLSQAFAPFGVDGSAGKAAAGTRRELAAVLDQAGPLMASLSAVEDAALDVFRLVPRTIPLMLATYVTIQLGVVSFLLMCFGATLYVCVRHPVDALKSFSLSPLGFVFFCLRSVLIEATTRLFASRPPPSRAEAIADLRRQVEKLRADLAARLTSPTEAS